MAVSWASAPVTLALRSGLGDFRRARKPRAGTLGQELRVALPVIKQYRTDLRNKKSCWLTAHASNVTSQFGEDGIIAKLFETIGERSRWCVELGAWDGKRNSNTHTLIASRRWSGVLIEGSAEKFPVLQATYVGNPRAVCVNAIVQPSAGPNSLEGTLSRTQLPKDFDLLSIDIDGNDYYLWASLETYRPRVLVIEFNPIVPNDIVFIQDADVAINQGCSLRALIGLGKKKGYELAAVTTTNAIFVVKDEFSKLGIEDNTIDAMFSSMCDGKYFDGYDGTLYHIGSDHLHWKKKIRLGVDELQILWRPERGYGDAIAKDRFRKWKRRGVRFIRTRAKALMRQLGV